MAQFKILHRTIYDYHGPVQLGEHRFMLRPRDSHDLRIVNTDLTTEPAAKIEWMHDVFGNSIAIATFKGATRSLAIESTLELERFAGSMPKSRIEPQAQNYPFQYSSDDKADLGKMLERRYPDPQGRLSAWVRGFIRSTPTNTLALLDDLNRGINKGLRYIAREAEGTQPPLQTLEFGSGTCRDYAFLMMEAARTLGIGARFVSGYFYDPALDDGLAKGTTHAWAELYLPGVGWLEYDPTNALISNVRLIRVAVTRDPSQAVPIRGTFSGGLFKEMRVEVSVHAQ